MKAGGDINKIIKDRCGTAAGRAKQQCGQAVQEAHQIACGGVSDADKSICLDRFVEVEQGLYAVQDANRRLSKRQKNILTVQSYAENRDEFAKIGRKIFNDEVKKTKNISKLIDTIVNIVPEETRAKAKKALKELKELGEIPGADTAKWKDLLISFLTQAHEKLGGKPKELADLFENREIQNTVQEAGRTTSYRFEFGEQREKISLKEVREFLLSKAGGYCVFEKDSKAQKNCEAIQKFHEQRIVHPDKSETIKNESEGLQKAVIAQNRERDGIRKLSSEEGFYERNLKLKTNATKELPVKTLKAVREMLASKAIPDYTLRFVYGLPFVSSAAILKLTDIPEISPSKNGDSRNKSYENFLVALLYTIWRGEDSYVNVGPIFSLGRITPGGGNVGVNEKGPIDLGFGLALEWNKVNLFGKDKRVVGSLGFDVTRHYPLGETLVAGLGKSEIPHTEVGITPMLKYRATPNTTIGVGARAFLGLSDGRLTIGETDLTVSSQSSWAMIYGAMGLVLVEFNADPVFKRLERIANWGLK